MININQIILVTDQHLSSGNSFSDSYAWSKLTAATNAAPERRETDTECWSNSAGQAASVEDMDR